MNKAGLPPLLDGNTKVLILGSFPGQESLKKKQYYANPSNQFWRLMKDLLQWKVIPEEYEKRRALLLKSGIGIWDVFKSCSRESSRDHKIRNAKVNNIDLLLKNHAQIKAVFCNGKKAFKCLQEVCTINTHIGCLPSSSSALAMSLNIKVGKWRKIQEYLEIK